MIKLWKNYLKFYKKEVVIGPLFKIIEAIFELIVPFVVSLIIDKGINENYGSGYILKMGLILLALAVTGLCSTLVCQYVASYTTQGFGTKLRNDLYKHALSLSQKEIDSIGKSKIVTIINNDTNQMQQSVALLIRLVIRAPFLIVGATIMSLFISVKIGLIFITSGIIIAGLIILVMRLSIPHSKRVQQGVDKLTNITLENLQGARTVRAFNKKEYEIDRYNKKCDDIYLDSLNFSKINAFLNPLTLVFSNIAIILIIYLTSFEVNIGGLLQGQVIQLVNYMSQISIAIVVVVNLVITFSKASASGARINEFFKVKSSLDDGKCELGEIQDKFIEFKNVSFGYNEGASYALENISFCIHKNETIGIIGGTGSGKSTLAALIERIYDVNEGEILINGVNIKDLKLDDIHKRISVVYQKNSLFSSSIKDNLLMGNKDATSEDIDRALKIAKAKEFVDSKEKGIDEILYQQGKNLSGGQKQRLCIARSLISNPSLLILDDSTSALDFKTDYELRKNIKEEMLDTTLIIISQRPSSIKYADKIIVLDGGKMVGIGSHDELKETCDVYKEILNSQVEKEDDSDE